MVDASNHSQDIKNKHIHKQLLQLLQLKKVQFITQFLNRLFKGKKKYQLQLIKLIIEYDICNLWINDLVFE